MKNSQIFLLLIFSLTIIASCQKEDFISFEQPTIEKPNADVPIIQTNPYTFGPVIDWSKPFCTSGDEKDAFHSNKIQKNFDCEIVVFAIEVKSIHAPLQHQIDIITEGIQYAAPIIPQSFDIEYTENVEAADIIYVWGDPGDSVPPNGDPMPESLGAAFLPTDANVNGYTYIKNGIVYFDQLEKAIGHEFGHWLGFKHTHILDYALMNPHILQLTPPRPEEQELGRIIYPIENCL